MAPLYRVSAGWLGPAAGAAIIAGALLHAFGYGYPDATALIGLGVAALSLVVGKPSTEDFEQCKTPWWLLPASACAAAVPLLPIVLHSGMPAMQHDWRWPLDAAEVQRWWPQMLTAWDASGWGGRTTQPGLDPAIALISLSAFVLSAKGALVALLLTALAAGAYGAGTVACRLIRSPAAALVAVAAYAANPVVINKIGAGHTLFFIAYATVPWLFLIMSGSSPPHRRAALGGMLIGLSAVQPQFIVYSAIVCIAGAAAGSNRYRGLAAFGAIALGVAISLPMIAANVGGPPVGFRSPTTQWQILLSSPPAQAVGWDGYFGRYFSSQGGSFANIPFALLTAAGLCVARHLKVTRSLAVLMLAGFVIIIGFAGPWERAFEWIFLTFPTAAAFRELYHAAPLIAFSGSVLGAVAIDRSRSATGRSVALAGIIVAVAALAAPWKLPTYRGDAVVSEVSGVFDPRGGGIASLPLTHPVGEPPHYGLDPSAWSEPGIPAYWMYEPTQPALAVGTAFACGDAALPALLQRTDVGYALVHRSWRSGAAVNPSIPIDGTAPCLLPQGARFVWSTKLRQSPGGDAVAQFALTSNGGWKQGQLPTTTRVDAGCENKLPQDFTDASLAAAPLAVDAGANWVPARPYYLEHPEFAYAPAVGVYTRSARTLTVTVHSGSTWFLLWSNGAVINADDHRSPISTGGRVEWRRVDAWRSVTIAPTAATAIFGWSASAPVAQQRGPCQVLQVEWTRSKSTEWSANLAQRGPGTVIFRQRFDTGWVLRVGGERASNHFVVDGYANGWYVPAGLHGAATATYAPQARLNVWLAVSGITWLVCLGMYAGRRGRNTEGVAPGREENPN